MLLAQAGFSRSRCLTSAVLALMLAGGWGPLGNWLASAQAADSARQSKEDESKSPGRESRATVTGEVQQISGQTLTIAREGGETQAVQVTSDTRINLNGKHVSLSQLKKGDRVTVRMSPDVANTAALVRASRAGERREARQRESAATGKPSPANLGIVVIPTPEGKAGIWRVAPRSPAARAGLQPGDEIVQLDGQTVASPEELKNQIGQLEPGQRVRIVFLHEGQEETATVRLARREELGETRRERRAARPTHEEEGEETMQEPERERASQAWLGMLLGEPEEEGVRVARVFPDSPASQAGVQRGDILQRLNDQKIDSAETAAKLLGKMKAGDKVRLQLVREGKPQRLEATLAGREGPRVLPRLRSDRRSGELDSLLEQQRQSEEHLQRMEGLLEDLKEEVGTLRGEVQELRKQAAESQKK